MILSVTSGVGSAVVCEAFDVTWEQFCDLQLQPDDGRTKEQHACIYPCAFEGGRRAEANVRGLWGVRCDIDQRHVSEEELRAALAPFTAVAWTSFNSTPDALRWAVIVGLEGEVTKPQYKALVELLVSVLPGASASQTDMSRARVAPVNRPGFRRFSTVGHPLSADRLASALVAAAPVPGAPVVLWELGPQDLRMAVTLRDRTLPKGDIYELMNLMGKVLVSVGYSCDDAAALLALGGEVDPRWAGEISRRAAVPGGKHLSAMWPEAEQFLASLGVVPFGTAAANDLHKIMLEVLAPKTTRRTKNPNHVYKCFPGHPPNGERNKASLAETMQILIGHPHWQGVFQYDEFADRIIAVDPPIPLKGEGKQGLQDVDAINVRMQLEVMHDILVGKDQAWDATVAAANVHTFHPVQDYLRALQPGNPRLFDGLAHRLFGATDPIEEVFLRKFMVAAVRRVFCPGTKVDSALVLYEEEGGKQKSTFVKELFGHAWVAPLGVKAMGSEEVGRKLQGNWCYEMGEMGAVTHGELEVVNEFMTAIDDHYRAPYGRVYQRRERQCVFTGTTNNRAFIRTSAHGRRFWPIEIRKMIDLTFLRAHRDDLWAAAVALAFATPMSDWMFDNAHWLTGEELAAASYLGKEYQDRDAWFDAVEEYCSGRSMVTCKEVYAARFAQQGGEGGYDNAKQARIVKVLRHLGCKEGFERRGGKILRGWRVPEPLASEALAANSVVEEELRKLSN